MKFTTTLQQVEDRITVACDRAKRRREEITLIAVTKTHPRETIQAAYDLGIRDFGENRVQELLKKKDMLPTDIRWHLIGQLQSNKAKYVAPFIHLVHSIETTSTAKELSKRAEKEQRIVNVLIEVNIANERTKSGIAPDDLPTFIDTLTTNAPHLNITGLMSVAPYSDNQETTRPYFAALRELAARHHLKELSMGMSNDFEIAIEEGATMIRVGSALFGER